MQLHEDYYAKSAFLGEIDDALAARIPDVHRVLTTDKTIYWAQQRSLKCISNQIKRAWRTVYVFHKQSDELVGFCRVVGDGEGLVHLASELPPGNDMDDSFAYLCDVFVTAQHNKKGSNLCSLVFSAAHGVIRDRELLGRRRCQEQRVERKRAAFY